MPLPLILNLTFRDPSAAAEAADKNPQGRRTWMCGVFRGGRMPPRKIPPAPRTRCKAPGAKAGCAFFAPGFFAQAKKGGSRRHGAKAFDLDSDGAGQEKIKRGSLRSRPHPPSGHLRTEEPTSELPSLMRTSYSVFCMKKKTCTTLSESQHTTPTR